MEGCIGMRIMEAGLCKKIRHGLSLGRKHVKATASPSWLDAMGRGGG